VPFIELLALISLNLAFINFLPIPALDGGHLAFYAIEAVRRKPVGPQATEWAYRTGILLVLTFMVVVTFNDVTSLPLIGGLFGS
jgi:regulator of sigma E protease